MENTGKFKLVINIIKVVFMTLLTILIVIWNGIEFMEYEWSYSCNTFVRACQYMVRFLWAASFCFSPGIVALSAYFFYNKLLLHKHPTAD